MKIIFLDIDGVLNRGSTVEKTPAGDEKPIKAKEINDIYYANVFVYHLLCDIKYIHTDSIKA